MTDIEKLNLCKKIANNALYFDDSSDFGSALWDIMKVVAPELCEDNVELVYIAEEEPK